MAEIKRKYSPQETERRRAQVLASMSVQVGQIFETLPALNSAVMFVAQYWADEAHDAVHLEMAYSLRSAPDIKDHLAKAASSEEVDGFLLMEGEETAAAIGYVNPYVDQAYEAARSSKASRGFLDWLFKPKQSNPTPAARAAPAEARTRGREIYDLLRTHFWNVGGWDDNGESIPLFAAFTKEGAHQEMPFGEAFLPYAMFHREAGAGVRVEIVGTMVRPWLDGVAPEFDPDIDNV